MTGYPTRSAAQSYYDDNYRVALVHLPEQRVIPPEDIERREFSSSCFRCEAKGPCRHRAAYFPESNRESEAA